jgi:hypothetical protein
LRIETKEKLKAVFSGNGISQVSQDLSYLVSIPFLLKTAFFIFMGKNDNIN